MRMYKVRRVSDFSDNSLTYPFYCSTGQPCPSRRHCTIDKEEEVQEEDDGGRRIRQLHGRNRYARFITLEKGRGLRKNVVVCSRVLFATQCLVRWRKLCLNSLDILALLLIVCMWQLVSVYSQFLLSAWATLHWAYTYSHGVHCGLPCFAFTQSISTSNPGDRWLYAKDKRIHASKHLCESSKLHAYRRKAGLGDESVSSFWMHTSI